MSQRARTNGFTLLEVMIALLVFSLGLIGLAGLLAISVQTNHGAYLRTQASFLAQGMSDRMRANILGVWNAKYAGTYDKTTGSTTATTTCLDATSATACGYAEIATRDGIVFSNQLASFLPNPSATIDCPAPATIPGADQLIERPPYTGLCTIVVGWTESALQEGQTGTPEKLAWVFQP